jgi:hypothetical protein
VPSLQIALNSLFLLTSAGSPEIAAFQNGPCGLNGKDSLLFPHVYLFADLYLFPTRDQPWSYRGRDTTNARHDYSFRISSIVTQRGVDVTLSEFVLNVLFFPPRKTWGSTPFEYIHPFLPLSILSPRKS